MRDLVRRQELEQAYDNIMVRENVQIIGQAGSGKSYLQRALSERLSGRRIIFKLNFTGLFQFPELVFRLRQCFESAGNQNAGLDYQMRRLHQEHPMHRIQNLKSLYEYLQALMNVLFQAGQDVVICLEDPEYCEVTEVQIEDLVSEFHKMSKAANIQLLLVSEKPFLKVKEQIILEAPEPSALWENFSEKEEQLWHYAKGNLAFLKALQEHLKSDSQFNAEAFFKPHHDYFLMLKGRFTDLQWRLLRALAATEQVEQPHAFDFLVAHKLGAASSVERALRNLLDTGFISRGKEAYQLKNPLLHRWLQHLYFHKSLSDFPF